MQLDWKHVVLVGLVVAAVTALVVFGKADAQVLLPLFTGILGWLAPQPYKVQP